MMLIVDDFDSLSRMLLLSYTRESLHFFLYLMNIMFHGSHFLLISNYPYMYEISPFRHCSKRKDSFDSSEQFLMTPTLTKPCYFNEMMITFSCTAYSKMTPTSRKVTVEHAPNWCRWRFSKEEYIKCQTHC